MTPRQPTPRPRSGLLVCGASASARPPATPRPTYSWPCSPQPSTEPFFGPARPVTLGLGLAQPDGSCKAWATTPARRAAQPGMIFRGRLVVGQLSFFLVAQEANTRSPASPALLHSLLSLLLLPISHIAASLSLAPSHPPDHPLLQPLSAILLSGLRLPPAAGAHLSYAPPPPSTFLGCSPQVVVTASMETEPRVAACRAGGDGRGA